MSGIPAAPRPMGPPPITVPASMLTGRDAVLQRARQVVKAHSGGETEETKGISSDWKEFFDEKRSVHVPACACTFNVYLAGHQSHETEAGFKRPLIFCVHGGGYTGLSFALIAEELKAKNQVVAFDMRYHGETECDDPDAEFDMSKETLCKDIVELWKVLFAETAPPTVLLGHSVGGAIAVWTAEQKAEGQCIPDLEGLVVIDVVEGTALSALPSMTSILNKRPTTFVSPEAAIKWLLDENMCRSRRAAAISLPSQLVARNGAWHWRTPLLQSEPFWEGWYHGLSNAFLAVSAPKVLILAGADRLDKELTIAQMQGKFQMVLVPNSGHAVHEDDCEEVIETVATFIRRFRVGQGPLVFPTAPTGAPPVLPQAAGPLHVPSPSL